MRLIGHIIAKDVRRVAWVWLAWLALVGAGTTWAELNGGFLAGNFVATLWWLVVATGVLLCGVIGLEDPVSDSRAMWRTRPIGRSRMLVAKLLGAVAMIGVAPVIVTLPVRIGKDVWLRGAADELLLLPLIVPALAVASLARDLGHFVVCAAFLAVLRVSLSAGVAAWPATGAAARIEQQTWLNAPVWPFMAVVLVVQMLTGRTRLGWGLIAAGLAGQTLGALWPVLAHN